MLRRAELYATIWAVSLLCFLTVTLLSGATLPGAPVTSAAAVRLAVAPTASLLPHFTIVPASGPPQANVTVNGIGFTPGDHLAVYFVDLNNQTTSLGNTTVAANGSVLATVSIPQTAAQGGVGLVVLRSTQAMFSDEVSTPFAVTPLLSSLIARPSVVTGGSTVTVSGSGFEPGLAVRLHLFDGTQGVALLGTGPITSSASGTIGPIEVVVPPIFANAGVAHQLVIDAADTDGNTAGLPLTIVPSRSVSGTLQLQPSRVVLGGTVLIDSTGFAPEETVAVSLSSADGSSVDVPAFEGATAASNSGSSAFFGVPLTADAQGTIQGLFTVPLSGGVVRNDIPGRTSNGGSLLTVTLRGLQSGTVTSAPLLIGAPQLRTLPPITTPGHPYTIQGSGFAAGEVVNIAITDSNGSTTLLGHYTAASCESSPGSQPATATNCEMGTFSALSAAPQPPESAFTLAQSTQSSSTPPTVSYVMNAVGQSSGLAANARLNLTNAPTLTLQHYVVIPGQSLIVVGSAFTANALVRLTVNFPSGSSNCPAGDPATAGTGICVSTLTVETDQSGSFNVPITAPLSTPNGPVAIQVQDAQGDQASTVLTISTQYPIVHAPLFAQPGQVLAIRGGGFSSGETIDLSLVILGSSAGGSSSGTAIANARCGSLVAQPLPNSTITSTADARGGFIASYPLPQPFIAGTYYLAALGETSQICAFTPMTIASTPPTALPSATPCKVKACAPSPTPSATPLATPVSSCDTQSDPHTAQCVQDTVTYFADGSTAQVTTQVQRGTAYPGLPCVGSSMGKVSCVPAVVSYREELHLLNESKHPIVAEVSYLVYGITAPQAVNSYADPVNEHPSATWLTPAGGGKVQVQRLRTMVLPADSVSIRSVNADVGDGHLVSIIVRTPGKVAASVVTHRMLLVQGCEDTTKSGSCTRTCSVAHPCEHELDAASSAGSGLTGPKTNWLFPQGYAGGGFDEYISLFNPQTDSTLVQIRAIGASGPLGAPIAIVLPPFGRQSVDLLHALQSACTNAARSHRTVHGCPFHPGSISLQVITTEPVVVERALYWGQGAGPTRAGFDVGPGVADLTTRDGLPSSHIQYIPFASTLQGDQAFLSIVNPTIRAATVTVNVYGESGMKLGSTTAHVAAQSNASVNLSRLVYPGVYALSVQSTVAIASELAQYLGGSPQSGAHAGLMLPITVPNAAGSSPAMSAGSDTAGAVSIQILNTGKTRAVMSITIDGVGGSQPLAQYQIAPNATLRVSTAHAPGVTITCGGPCVALMLSNSVVTHGTTSSAWGDTLQ